MHVRDLMQTDVVTLDISANLDVADGLMRQDRIRHLPVVEDGRLAGLISQRDLFRAGISCVLRFQPGAETEWLAKIAVAQVMTRDVFTVHPDASVRAAVELMIQQRVGCLPVVEDERLVGLIAESDCMRYLARILGIEEQKAALPERDLGD
jgi:CBS domain-containing protein